MNSREYYDALASDFDEQDEFWNNPYDSEIWWLEHDLLRPYLDLNAPLLDIACGFYPHDAFPDSMPLVAGDISLGSLQVASRHLPVGKRVDLVQFDVARLPFRNASFKQAIAGGELLNHIPYQIALVEIARVLMPAGVLLLEFGEKWCLDTIWALLDSILGGRIGYSVSSEQARAFFRLDSADAEVTWEITPTGKFTLKLLAFRNVRDALTRAGLEVLEVRSTNLMSGLIPLPLQQEGGSLAIGAASTLLRVDRLLGRIPVLNRFAGNVFMIARKLP